MMKFSIILLLALLPAAGISARDSMATRLFEDAITRDVPPDRYVYNWRDAVLLKAFTDIYRSSPQERDSVADYVALAMTRVAPAAHGKHPNGIASAVGFAFLKEIGRNTVQTDEALERVLSQYLSIRRASNGACSHRPGTVELWDDTLYMIGMTLTGCFRATGDTSFLKTFAGEILAHSEHLYDPGTGLWYHGWAESGFPTDDECCQYGWNCNPLHRNGEFWGRGNGWIAMSLADILEFLPDSDPMRKELETMFTKMMKTLKRVQDRKSGLWRQLPLHTRDRENFTESSCTAMFGYAAAKGARIGVLPSSYLEVAEKAYSGITDNCLNVDCDGHLSVGKVCAGTCIGDKAYYYARRQTTGTETYATGAVLMLANELSKINITK